MKSKVAMFIYVAFALVSFLFGVKMFQMGDTLRGVLFMVAVACWGMCIYNNSGMNRRQKERNMSPAQNKNHKNKRKSKSR